MQEPTNAVHVSDGDSKTIHRKHARASSVADLARSVVQQVFLKGFPLRVALAATSKKDASSITNASSTNRRRHDVSRYGMPSYSHNSSRSTTLGGSNKGKQGDFITEAKAAATKFQQQRQQHDAALSAGDAPRPPLPALEKDFLLGLTSSGASDLQSFPRRTSYAPGTAQVLL